VFETRRAETLDFRVSRQSPKQRLTTQSAGGVDTEDPHHRLTLWRLAHSSYHTGKPAGRIDTIVGH
jgi:hypothetical protein